MSDLHLEFHRDNGIYFMEDLDPTDVDVLILAGDIVPSQERLSQFARLYPTVVYVPGNHEFYGHDALTYLDELRDMAGQAGVVFLNNEVTTINGQVFLGGPMWFREPNARTRSASSGYRDFKAIRHFEPWVYEQNAAFLQLLDDRLEPNCIVVSHFMPFLESVHPKYQNERSNAFFVCEVNRDLVLDRKPALWVHGHTHEQCDYRVGDTRVLCNPLGYPHEIESGMAFQDRLIVHI